MLVRVTFALAGLVQVCDGRDYSTGGGHTRVFRHSSEHKLAAASAQPNATLEAEMAAKVGPDMANQLKSLEATRDKIEDEIVAVRTDASREKDAARRAELSAKADRMQTVDDQIKLHFGIVSATLDDNSAQAPVASASVHRNGTQMVQLFQQGEHKLAANSAQPNATLEAEMAAKVGPDMANQLKGLEATRDKIEGEIATVRTDAAREKNAARKDELTAKADRMQQVYDQIKLHFGIVSATLDDDASAQTPVASASTHTNGTVLALEARKAAKAGSDAAIMLKSLQAKRAEIEVEISTLRTKAAAEKNTLRRAELTAKADRMQKVQDQINQHFGVVSGIEDEIKQLNVNNI